MGISIIEEEKAARQLMKRTASLTYEDDWYTPTSILTQIKTGNMKKVRKEYTRLRDISQKRLKRLEAADMGDTQAYLKNVHHYPKLKDIKTKYELAGRLSDLSRFIKAEASTVSGQRKIRAKSIQTLHDHGYDFVNDTNIVDFGRFMEEYRKQKLEDMGYDSGDAAETYSVVVKHELDPEEVKKDFEFWLENLATAKTLRRSKASKGSAERIKKRIIKKTKTKKRKSRVKTSRRRR